MGVGVTCKLWLAPGRDYVQINVGASFLADTMETGIRMIMHDEEGQFMSCRTMVRTDLLQVDDGEAWGVEALRWAYNLDLNKVQVETNSKRVADAFWAKDTRIPSFGDFLSSRKKCIEDRPLFFVRWICRTANNLAHILDRTAREHDSPHYWVEPPNCVGDLLNRCFSCI